MQRCLTMLATHVGLACLLGCRPAPAAVTGAAAVRLQVDVHWRGQADVTAETSLQRDVEVNAAHDFVVNDSDLHAVGDVREGVPLVLAGQTQLACRRPAVATFADTETAELREPLGSRGGIICHWPGMTGRHTVTVIAQSVLQMDAQYVVTVEKNSARLQARYYVPTTQLGTAAQPARGGLALWYWHAPTPSEGSIETTPTPAGTSQPMLERDAIVEFRGGVVLIERTATVAISRHVAVYGDDKPDGQFETDRVLRVADEVELATLPMPILPDRGVTVRWPNGRKTGLRGAALDKRRLLEGHNDAVTVVKTSQDYRVRGGRARSHKYVFRNNSAAPVVVECWVPVPKQPLGFWQAPQAIVGPIVLRDGWSMTPVTVPANGETWIARGWRLP